MSDTKTDFDETMGRIDAPSLHGSQLAPKGLRPPCWVHSDSSASGSTRRGLVVQVDTLQPWRRSEPRGSHPHVVTGPNLKTEVVLWLADDAKHSQPVPPGVKTVGFERAVELVKHRSAIGRYSSTLDELRRQRNGIAHIGDAGDESATQLER